MLYHSMLKLYLINLVVIEISRHEACSGSLLESGVGIPSICESSYVVTGPRPEYEFGRAPAANRGVFATGPYSQKNVGRKRGVRPPGSEHEFGRSPAANRGVFATCQRGHSFVVAQSLFLLPSHIAARII